MPPTGWVLRGVDPKVFALIIDCLMTINGFEGYERGLNLVLLLTAIRQCLSWGMTREIRKLIDTVRKYIPRRFFYRNPHLSDSSGVMNHNYFAYRSEEIYRTWKIIVDNAAMQVNGGVSQPELVALYGLCIPDEMWPALMVNMDQQFVDHVEFTKRFRPVPPSIDFQDWWLYFFRLAGNLDYG